jgi:hypothetical protein
MRSVLKLMKYLLPEVDGPAKAFDHYVKKVPVKQFKDRHYILDARNHSIFKIHS